MSDNETTDLVKAEPTVTDLALSDIEPMAERPVETGILEGLHGLNPNEIRLPRVAIAQGLSKAMTPGDSAYIESLKMFDMYNDRTGQVYGKGPLLVVPIRKTKKRIEFDPNDRNIMLDPDVPPNDPRMTWDRSVTPNLPPRATEFYEFICLALTPGQAPEPVVVSISTKNKWDRRAAEDFWNNIEMRGVSIYRGLYRVASRPEKNDKGTFGVYGVKNAGFIPATPAGKALLAMAKDFHDSLAGKTIVVDRENPNDDPDTFDTTAMDAEAKTSEM